MNNELKGVIQEKESIIGTLNNKEVLVYPELEDIIVESTKETQQFKSKKYGYNQITVKSKTVLLQDKNANKNGEYVADEGYDGLGKVTVETAGVDINDYFYTEKGYSSMTSRIKKIPALDTSDMKDMTNMFLNFFNLLEVPKMDTSNVTNMAGMFTYCSKLKAIKDLDTRNVTDMSSMFYQCSDLEEINYMNTSKVTTMREFAYNCRKLKKVSSLDLKTCKNVGSMLSYCYNLEEAEGFLNLGKAYSTDMAENYSNYTLDLRDCRLLTHDSLLNIINNLYNIKKMGCKTQKLWLGSINLEKLTADEIALATNKGWNVT